MEAGKDITVELFSVGQKVDVAGNTIGKGFQGKIRRWNGHRQPESHGNSLSHRVLGSTGQNQSPGRVFPGKKMPGQLGDVRKTMQNLEVVRVDAERHLLLIKGSVPGAKGGNVIVMPTSKGTKKNKQA
jgi:large subunit ribosomal protein L3